jgi:hypothetical protein
MKELKHAKNYFEILSEATEAIHRTITIPLCKQNVPVSFDRLM